MASLDSIPQEVLEHIAFFVATDAWLGPPSNLVPLLVSNRRIHSLLSITTNPHLYARVFANKFDLQPVSKRLGVDALSPSVLSVELKQRSIYLKRIRLRRDAYSTKGGGRSKVSLHQLLFHVYIWLLENEGKNERQLRDYARIDTWLHEFWFNYDGASNAMRLIQEDKWPTNDRNAALAMWLYWFLLKPGEKGQSFMPSIHHLGVVADEYNPDDKALDILCIFGLAAHKVRTPAYFSSHLTYMAQYNLTPTSWTEFLPASNSDCPSLMTHFGRDFELIPLPAAIPAILSFLTLVNRASSPVLVPHPPLPVKSIARAKPSSEWECEWSRCISLAQMDCDIILTEIFKPGR